MWVGGGGDGGRRASCGPFGYFGLGGGELAREACR